MKKHTEARKIAARFARIEYRSARRNNGDRGLARQAGHNQGRAIWAAICVRANFNLPPIC